jgi:glucosamine--fructose-6-phosphate aminotransferase (isomerizing)
MCGIVGAIAQRNITGILVEGLKRLEYRGYDSAGVAVLRTQSGKSVINICKREGKVANVEEALAQHPLKGHLGIAHTRWATHGVPSEANAHPHFSSGKQSSGKKPSGKASRNPASGRERIVVVHNGIIENYAELKQQLIAEGYGFVSDTDTEVIAHFIHKLVSSGKNLLEAVKDATAEFRGAYALGVIDTHEPDTLVAARSGSPLVIGIGIEENFIASDTLALRQVTDRFIYLEEGDIATLTVDRIAIFDRSGNAAVRKMVKVKGDEGIADKGAYDHFMYKEIYEQPAVLAKTLQDRIGPHTVDESCVGRQAHEILARVEAIHIVACGTSYHAGMIAKHWIEDLAGIPCGVDIASEYRYRKVLIGKNTLFLGISQSGETADTLAALRARKAEYLSAMAICNVDNSSLVRESDHTLLTFAGPEIGVASTKAFTTQLAALQVFALALAKIRGAAPEKIRAWVEDLNRLPELARQVLVLDATLKSIADQFANKHNALFLGRGAMYPVAKEGALKLKEISYIHAEAYAAGELKHGPLALVDENMPVIAVAPNNELLDKLKSNLQEVRARGGRLYVFSDITNTFENTDQVTLIRLPPVPDSLAPIIYTIPLQLLSYYVALIKGTDVDKPRNLAKSVTVE